MILKIDTSNSEKIIIYIDDKKYVSDSREEKSQKLLSFIDETLRKEELKVEDINEIYVNTGPGSFTGLRVGVSVANTLGWILKVPVNGKDIGKGETVEIVYE